MLAITVSGMNPLCTSGVACQPEAGKGVTSREKETNQARGRGGRGEAARRDALCKPRGEKGIAAVGQSRR